MISNFIAHTILESKMKQEKAVVIQSFWKRMTCRRRILKQQIEKRNYHMQVKKNARIKIQSWWRQQILVITSYRQRLRIQSLWKNMAVTLMERDRSQAAKKLQLWISYKLNKQRRFCAANKIQISLRYFMKQKGHRRMVYKDKILRIVLMIQAFIRSKLLRLELTKHISAATLIQKVWKRCMIRHKFKEAIKAANLRLLEEQKDEKYQLQKILYERSISNFRQRIRSKAACKIQQRFREYVHRKRIIMKLRLEGEFLRLQQIQEAKRVTAMLRRKQERRRIEMYMKYALVLLNKAKSINFMNVLKLEMSRRKDEPKNRKQILFDLLNPSGDLESIYATNFRKHLKNRMKGFQWFNNRLEKLMLQYFIWPNDMFKIRK
jgi:hypothetical protein